GLQQGVWLNVLLAAMTALAIFGVGREAFGDDVEAALLAGVWVLSPATIGTSTEARPYDLFALVTVLFTWQLLRVTRPGWSYPPHRRRAARRSDGRGRTAQLPLRRGDRRRRARSGDPVPHPRRSPPAGRRRLGGGRVAAVRRPSPLVHSVASARALTISGFRC